MRRHDLAGGLPFGRVVFGLKGKVDQAGQCGDCLKFCPAVTAPGLQDCALSVLPCLVGVEVGAGEIAPVEPVGRDRVSAPGLAAGKRGGTTAQRFRRRRDRRSRRLP